MGRGGSTPREVKADLAGVMALEAAVVEEEDKDE